MVIGKKKKTFNGGNQLRLFLQRGVSIQQTFKNVIILERKFYQLFRHTNFMEIREIIGENLTDFHR